MTQEFVFKYRNYDSKEALSKEDQELLAHAQASMEQAYAPYSKFQVGASVLLKSGKIILGNNQENIAYPSGLCAERVALFYAGANFPDDPVVKICIISQGELMPEEAYLSPCGSCRQVLLESQARQKSPIEVLLVQRSGKILAIDSVQNLLPFGFTK